MLYHPPTGSTDPNSPYIGKNVAAGIQGSKVPPGAVEATQREIVNAVLQSGQAPTDSDLNQLTRAIRGGQLDYAADTGSADALLCAVGLAHITIKAGLPFTVMKGGAANATTTPRLTLTGPNGVGPLTGTILKANGALVAIGDLPANAMLALRADGTNFRLLSVMLASDVLQTITANRIGIQNPLPAVTTPGTYTYTPSSPGVRAILVHGQAAGGGGGGSSNCTASQMSVGVPGAGGGYFEHYMSAGFSGLVYVVGAGGAGGSSAGGVGAAGGPGGTTGFAGGFALANGGQGGGGGGTPSTPAYSNTAAVGGGTAGGGNLVNISGGGSQASQYLGSTAYGGLAGPSQLGKSAIPFATTNPGTVGVGYGSGGTAGVTLPGGVGQNGGSGANGLLQITEIF